MRSVHARLGDGQRESTRALVKNLRCDLSCLFLKNLCCNLNGLLLKYQMRTMSYVTTHHLHGWSKNGRPRRFRSGLGRPYLLPRDGAGSKGPPMSRKRPQRQLWLVLLSRFRLVKNPYLDEAPSVGDCGASSPFRGHTRARQEPAWTIRKYLLHLCQQYPEYQLLTDSSDEQYLLQKSSPELQKGSPEEPRQTTTRCWTREWETASPSGRR